MTVKNTKFLGNWVTLTYESSRSQNIYEIHSHWDGHRWEAVSCTCKGFTHRATCRHLKDTEEYMKDVPAPKLETDPVLKVDFWYKCPICNGVEFMIRPNSEKSPFEIICSQCGRMYKLCQ